MLKEETKAFTEKLHHLIDNETASSSAKVSTLLGVGFEILILAGMDTEMFKESLVPDLIDAYRQLEEGMRVISSS